jgi:hypothetical protein
MNSDKFSGQTETKSSRTIHAECKNGQIDLSAPYQRGAVWSLATKQGYIDSIFRGIIPNPIILNIEDETAKLICLDGKQRLTALIEFMDNKYYFEYENVEDDNIEYIYYKDITNASHKGSNNYRILKTNELSFFDNRSIPIVKYTNLSYEDQINIFNRIQNSLKLTRGELIMSMFKNDNMCKIFKDFISQKNSLVEKYVRREKKRGGNTLLLTDIVYLLKNGQLCKDNKIREKFYKGFKSSIELNKMLKSIGPIIDLYFSKKVLNNSVFTTAKLRHMSESMILNTLLYCQKYTQINESISLDIKTIIADSLNEYIKTYNAQKKKKKHEQTYLGILDHKLQDYSVKEQISISDSDSDNDNNNHNANTSTNNSDSSSDSESESKSESKSESESDNSENESKKVMEAIKADKAAKAAKATKSAKATKAAKAAKATKTTKPIKVTKLTKATKTTKATKLPNAYKVI